MKKYQTLRGLIFNIMRFTTLQLLLITVVSGVATATPYDVFGQTVLDEVISISAESKKIKQVLLEIEKSVSIKFTYNPQSIAVDQKITVDYRNQKLSKVLDGIFQPLHVDYQLSGGYIILKKQNSRADAIERERTVLNPVFDVAGSISGTVVDEEGLPLPGVSVTIKNTLVGAATDTDGKYAFSGTDKSSILVFSFIGYKTQEVLIGEQVTVDVKMITDIEALGEVVVVGYGTQKEYTSAGAISTVNVQKQLQYGTTRSISNNLAGQVAGIIGVQRSGEPGFDDSNFWIRGISTFAGARQPLVLVDGVERSLNNIDPAEIESFSVLKDASASAVYGVRGANGVVLINTKRGAVGKPSITVRYEQGFTQPVKLPGFLDAAGYMELMNNISTDAGLVPNYSEERINNTRNQVDPDLYPDVNWLDAVTKDHASNGRLNVTASGGTNFLRYSIVGSHYAEQGIIARDPKKEWDSSLKLKRYNIRSNVDLDVTPTTLLRVNIGGFLQDDTRPPQSVDALFDRAFETSPHVHPAQYSTGEIPRVNADRVNPWALATQTGYQRASASKLETLFALEQNLDAVLPGLSGRLKFSFDRFSANRVVRSKDPDYYQPATGRNDDGTLNLTIDRYGQIFLDSRTESDFGNKNIYIEGSFSYSHNIGNHYIDALLLYNQRSYDDGNKLPFRFQGTAARVSYSFKRKYIAEVNFGYNGTENFARGHRFGFFPSVALGWLITEENFMSSMTEVLSRLKLRGSIGQVGNDRFDNDKRFAYLSTISDTDGYRWGVNNDFNRAGRREGSYGVTNLTWETVTKSNAGVELGLWNSVLLQADFFREARKDIFLNRKTIPASSGFIESPFANYGKVENHGVDLSLSANKQLSQDFYISGQGTFTYAKNKIIEQDEAPGVIGTYRSTTGKSVNQNFGFVAERLYTVDDFADVEDGVLVNTLPQSGIGAVRPGDIKYTDLNGDGFVRGDDQTALRGTVDPQVVYGFGIGMKYKNIDFGFFFQGNARTYRMLGGGFFMPGSGNGAAGNIYNNVDDRWTVDNPSQDVFWPRLSFSSTGNNSVASTWWLKDMSMLRMKHIEIGYSIPKILAQKAYLKNLRIFITGNNLVTFSSFKLWDPEINTGNGFRYPIMKSVSAGFNLEF